MEKTENYRSYYEYNIFFSLSERGSPDVFLARHVQPHPFHNVISPPWLSDFPVEYQPSLTFFPPCNVLKESPIIWRR